MRTCGGRCVHIIWSRRNESVIKVPCGQRPPRGLCSRARPSVLLYSYTFEPKAGTLIGERKFQLLSAKAENAGADPRLSLSKSRDGTGKER